LVAPKQVIDYLLSYVHLFVHVVYVRKLLVFVPTVSSCLSMFRICVPLSPNKVVATADNLCLCLPACVAED
jgi:hypothetical protein